MRPLNHGFTVWRSDETTSTGSGAIKERMWSETSSSATCIGCCRESTTSQVEPLATTAATAIEAARASHDGFARWRLVPPTEDSIRARNPGGAASRGKRS